MRLRRCPGGVKASTLSRHVRGLGFDSESGLRILFVIVVFTLCLPLFINCLSACTLKRGAPSTASCLTHS